MTKFGIVIPVIAVAMTAWSAALFWRSAASVPRPIPITTASMIARPPTLRLAGKPVQSSSATVKSRYLNDGPKSPWSTPSR